ncbi:hypothetical protein [Paraburkholderia silvatlantica]|uniref:hypothetical protein n=1 Tax=Paraburkholderia silvatlantica TaxID=321895 RepID=UPI0037508EE4
MMKQSHTGGRSAIQHDLAKRGAFSPLRIAIRLWGYDASSAQTWIEALPTLDGLLLWTIALAPSSPGADITLHMVKPSKVPGAPFCWNCVGANRSVARMGRAMSTAFTLFAGHADQLPPARSGLWITCGALPPRAALARLAHLIAAATMPTSSDAVTLRYRVLELIARDLDIA